MARRSWGERLRGALALDPEAYRDIGEDWRSVLGALAVVVGATVLAGFGTLLWTRWGGRAPERAIYQTDIDRLVQRSFIAGGLIQVALWGVMLLVAWAYLRSFGEQVSLRRLAAPMGFAFAPMSVQFLIFPPGMELGMAAVALGWTFAAEVAAVRAVAGTTPGRAATSALAGFALLVIALSLLGNSDTDLAPGIFPLDSLPTSIGIRTTR